MKAAQKILIIDDDVAFLDTYRLILGEEGYVIDTARDRTSALSMLDRDEWSVVLIDQKLQGSRGPDSGLELIAEAQARAPGAKLMIVTGYASGAAIERAFEAGVYDYLEKTEIFEALLRAKIRNALEVSRERDVASLEMDERQAKLLKLWQDVRSEADPHRKGKLLEDCMVVLFSCIPGLDRVLERRENPLEEIDLMIRNESADPFWNKESPYLLVECKNWSKPVGVDELRSFLWKLHHRYGRCRLGFFVSPQGFTGPFDQELRAQRNTGTLVVALDGASLGALIAATDKSAFLKERIDKAVTAAAQ